MKILSASIVFAGIMTVGISREGLAQKPYQPPASQPSNTHVHTYPDPRSSTGQRTEIHQGPARDTSVERFKTGVGQAWKSTLDILHKEVKPPPPIPNAGGVRGFAHIESSSWTGSWVRQDCSETKQAAGICCVHPSSGKFSLHIEQIQSNVTGTLFLGGFEVPLHGSRDQNGLLLLTGDHKTTKAAISITALELPKNGGAAPASFTATVTPNKRNSGAITLRALLEPMTHRPVE